MVQRREQYVNLIVCLIDTISLIISYLLGSYIWLVIVKEEEKYTYSNLMGNIGVVLASFMFIFFFFNMNRYFLRRSYIEEFFNVIKNSLFLGAIMTMVLFLTKNSLQFNRGVFVCTILFNVLVCTMFRAILKRYLRKYLR